VSTIRTHHRVKPTSPVHHAHAHLGSRHEHSSTDATPRIPTVPVGVYNNSGITGLASDKAATLEAAGWKVATTDNWYGDIPANTVYFPAGLRQDAVRLAKTLHITRLRPAVAPMPLDRLTVIFTSS
jgi:LytR cell envelope-related transcriptional attenuator